MEQDRTFAVEVKIVDTCIGFPSWRVFGSKHACFIGVNDYHAMNRHHGKVQILASLVPVCMVPDTTSKWMGF